MLIRTKLKASKIIYQNLALLNSLTLTKVTHLLWVLSILLERQIKFFPCRQIVVIVGGNNSLPRLTSDKWEENEKKIKPRNSL
jgi:hypothetical protein